MGAGKKQLLWDAEKLAMFANADTAEIQNFQAKYRDFFPEHFWEYRCVVGEVVTDRRVWQDFQQHLRESWERGFPLEDSIVLTYMALGSIFDVLEAQPESPHLPVWPYQRAVMFLGMESWRARFCGVCGKRFVADKPARRFCSNICSARARQASRSVSWSKHGKKWRSKYELRTRRSKAKSAKGRK